MTLGNRPPAVRNDGRRPNDLRPVTITLGVLKWAEGSCRIRAGDTEVLCAATLGDRVPPHLPPLGKGQRPVGRTDLIVCAGCTGFVVAPRGGNPAR